MKPEWCSQEIWDVAHSICVQVLAERGEQIKTMRPLIARALLAAEQRGMEKAAEIAEEHDGYGAIWPDGKEIASAIRQAARDGE